MYYVTVCVERGCTFSGGFLCAASVSHKQCLFLYLPKQHMKAAVGAEASAAERHNEIAYDMTGRSTRWKGT